MNEGRAKGPRVFLDYDQHELDDAYDQLVYAPNRDQITGRRALASEQYRARAGAPLRFAYGSTAVEQLDVYRAAKADAPVLVFIHGGAWRGGYAKQLGFAAELFVDAGVNYVVPDFVWVQDAGGSLMVMADQVRRAVAWTWRNARSFGGNPDRLYVAGHSSGGHLVSVLLTTDWARTFDLPTDVIKGGLCGSGMYELQPVRLSKRSAYVKFDDATVEALSAMRHLDRIACPITVCYGTFETPEFQRQNREFAAALEARGRLRELVVAEGYNHFEVMETLGNPYGPLGRAALKMLRQA